MKISRLPFLCLLLLISACTKIEEDEPYIFYFSDVLHSFVIEHPDGSNSRLFAQSIVPENHNTIDGAGWSTSGQWFAFNSYQTTTHSIGDASRFIISFDEETVIQLDEDWGFTSWSPTEDLLLVGRYNPEESSSYIGIFDPQKNKFIGEYRLDGTLSNFHSMVWNFDGSQISVRVYQNGSLYLYDLITDSLELREITSFSIETLVFDSYNPYHLTFVNAQNDIVIHDIFSHYEWNFPLGHGYVDSGLNLIWNAQQTELFLETPISSNLTEVYWLSLVENRIVPIQQGGNPISPNCPHFCISWHPDGNKAFFQTGTEPVIVFTPSLEQISIAGQSLFARWIGENQVLFYEHSRDYPSNLSLIDIQNMETQTFVAPYGVNRFYNSSPSGQYLQSGFVILESASFEIVARSRMSAGAMEIRPIWNADSDWLILSTPSFFPLSGNRALNYEVIKLHDSVTRELTRCHYSISNKSLCVIWLPEQVSTRLEHNNSPRSVVPAPSQEIIVDGSIHSLAWNPNGQEIQVITSDLSTETSILTTWDIATENILEKFNISYCELQNCELSWAIDEELAESNLPVNNSLNTLSFSFDIESNRYRILDLNTFEILQFWEADQISTHTYDFKWHGETLIFRPSHQRNFCYGYWNRQSQRNMPGSAYRCEFSPNEDFILFTEINTIDKSFLLDSYTGERIYLNFYARDIAFSPDGGRIALGGGTKLTIWELEDILANRE